jgi:hypothetical protein
MFLGNSNAYAYFLNTFIKLGSKPKEVTLMLVGINRVGSTIIQK